MHCRGAAAIKGPIGRAGGGLEGGAEDEGEGGRRRGVREKKQVRWVEGERIKRVTGWGVIFF